MTSNSLYIIFYPSCTLCQKKVPADFMCISHLVQKKTTLPSFFADSEGEEANKINCEEKERILLSVLSLSFFAYIWLEQSGSLSFLSKSQNCAPRTPSVDTRTRYTKVTILSLASQTPPALSAVN